MKVRKICATTWFVYAREDGPQIGTINYPGNCNTNRYQAIKGSRPGVIVGQFPDLDAAARAIFTFRQS